MHVRRAGTFFIGQRWWLFALSNWRRLTYFLTYLVLATPTARSGWARLVIRHRPWLQDSHKPLYFTRSSFSCGLDSRTWIRSLVLGPVKRLAAKAWLERLWCIRLKRLLVTLCYQQKKRIRLDYLRQRLMFYFPRRRESPAVWHKRYCLSVQDDELVQQK